MASPSEILDALGRENVRRKLGLTPSSLSDAIREGKFPARYYGPMRNLADKQGVDLPLELFHWRESA